MGLGIKLGDVVKWGTTGCFGSANLASSDFRDGGSVVVVVALVGGNSKALWEFKVEI